MVLHQYITQRRHKVHLPAAVETGLHLINSRREGCKPVFGPSVCRPGMCGKTRCGRLGEHMTRYHVTGTILIQLMDHFE